MMLTKKMMYAVLAFSLIIFLTTAATPLLQAQKQAKDQQEYELITKAFGTQPSAALIELLDQWKEKYPETAFDLERLQLYMQSYGATGQTQMAVDTARLIVDTKAPKNFLAHNTIVSSARALGKTDSSTLNTAKSSAVLMLDSLINTQFANKPAQVPQEQWDTVKNTVTVTAHQALAWIATQNKDHSKAAGHLNDALDVDENNGLASYELAQAVQNGAKTAEELTYVMFSYARAVVVDGPGALNDQARTGLKKYLTEFYAKFAGTQEGLEDLFAAAKESARPPEGFAAIKSAATREYEAQVAFKKNDPLRYEFVQLKKLLSQPTDPTWGKLRGKLTPKFRLFVVSATPARAPNKLMLTSTRGGNAEVTVNLTNRMRSAPTRGSRVTFQGVATTLTRSPFMLVLNDSKTE
tara:strand:- start:28049 stop:29275 length:1227 start_codon:yes stop_codon:yes gene_type:complete